MKVVYIAGPFRGKTAWDVAQNVRRAEVRALEVWALGAAALCPHANTANFDKTLTDQIYLDGTMEMLKRCDALITVPGYEISEGSRAEIQKAYDLRIPVYHDINALSCWLDFAKRMDS